MEFTNETSHAFIVRIRLEPRESENAEAIWRGVIVDLESGHRVYFDQLQQIAIYMLPYIEAMGITVDLSKS